MTPVWHKIGKMKNDLCWLWYACKVANIICNGDRVMWLPCPGQLKGKFYIACKDIIGNVKLVSIGVDYILIAKYKTYNNTVNFSTV